MEFFMKKLGNQTLKLDHPPTILNTASIVGPKESDDTGKDKFSFPDGLPDAQKYKQFGNSVTIPVIEEMAHFMLNCLDYLTGEQY